MVAKARMREYSSHRHRPSNRVELFLETGEDSARDFFHEPVCRVGSQALFCAVTSSIAPFGTVGDLDPETERDAVKRLDRRRVLPSSICDK